MQAQRRAVIDVGTNSVKLLVADVAGVNVWPVLETGSQTRLGQGFYETRRLQPAAIQRTVAAVTEFVASARQHAATSVRAFATSAARDAFNSLDLITAVEKACGLRLEIISGEREAEWAFQGACSNPNLARGPLLLLEVGGGSSQFILGRAGKTHLRASFDLGAVRLLETLPHSDPPQAAELEACRAWIGHYLHELVRPKLTPALGCEGSPRSGQRAIQLIGVGGTATVLARMHQGLDDYDRGQIEAMRLSREQLEKWVERLWSLPLAERMRIRGLPPERADVILTGAATYAAVMKQFDFKHLRVSTRGLRFAAVMECK